MALFVEKRSDKSKPRVFPLAVIEGEFLGMTIQVIRPEKFKEDYPFVLASFFQEVSDCAGWPFIFSPDDDEDEVNNQSLDNLVEYYGK